MVFFTNRQQAGRELAEKLFLYKDHPFILAIPRGGVVVGYEVAKKLGVPFDVIVVRKIGAPHEPELGIGAVAEGDVVYLDEALIERLGIARDVVNRIVQEKKYEIRMRVIKFRKGNPLPDLSGKTIIIVDDGLATGSTAQAAVRAVRALHPAKLLFVVPVCDRVACAALSPIVDDVICLHESEEGGSVGSYYKDFAQVSDEEVVRLLAIR